MNAQIFSKQIGDAIDRAMKEAVMVKEPTMDIMGLIGILEWHKLQLAAQAREIIAAAAFQQMQKNIQKPGDPGFQMPGGRG